LLIIIHRSAKILNIQMDEAAPKKSRVAAAAHRASRTACCGARAILRKCARRAASPRVAQEALQMLGVDQSGLDEVDRNLMIALLDKYAGGAGRRGHAGGRPDEEEDAIERDVRAPTSCRSD